MSGQITVDTTNEQATLVFVDDKGDTDAAPPVGAVVTFTSSNEAVLTIAADPANPLQGDVTPLAEGDADASATIADADGNPIMEADGVTPFAVAAVTIHVGPGVAVGAEFSLSV